jgi:kinesin family member 18/19
VSVLDDKVVILYDPVEVINSGGSPYEFQNSAVMARGKEKQYAFDYVFDRHVSQESVFDKSVKFALDGVMEGFNATVFTYGATGAGKTYTMLGTDEQYGVMGLTFLELFRKIEEQKKNKDFKILMSYLEIYNENIRDLLMSNNDKVLELREDSMKGMVVSNLTEVIATSVEEVMTLLRIGNKNRTTEATNANETSSRSHAIL